MVDDRKAQGFSLRRWSQRKLAAARDERTSANVRETAAPLARPAAERREGTSPIDDAPSEASAVAPLRPAPLPAVDAQTKPVLPPVESLTFDSDFTAFMQSGVDENVRRSALRKLLRDPRFNVMDGLDTYIDDYSKPSPIEPEVVRTLRQARYLFNPPKTRVNAEGVVEDVAEHETNVAGDASEGDELPAPGVADAIDMPRERLTVSAAPDTTATRDDEQSALAVPRRDTES